MNPFDIDGQTPLHSLTLVPEDLSRRVWQFGPRGHPPYARHVRLLADGRIAGRLGENESFWRVEKNRLVILDQFDRRSTVMDRIYVDEHGRLSLVGAFQAPGGQDHLLREVDPPGSLAEKADGLDLLWRRRGPRRPNLVILRADERSLHINWPREMLEDDRSWDLCISFHGEERNFHADPWSEYQVLQNRQTKYDALHSLLHVGSPLWDYDYIALPDDDLMLSWRDWNDLFSTCREHRLDLAQPALSPAGHGTHPITRQNENYLLRYVSFVEVMTPIFSRRALLACAPTFKGAFSGFGLDNIWPKLLGRSRGRVAIIDKTPVVFTRRPRPPLDIGAAIEEGNNLQWAYDAPSDILEHGGILLDPLERKAPE